MGFDKTVRPCGDLAPLQRIAAALGERDSVVVVPSRLRAAVAGMMPRAMVAINDEPDRGMTHSLRVALASIEGDDAVGVLLGDMPAITERTIARTEVLLVPGVDVAFPVDGSGRGGHPVLFAPRARAVLADLPDGDTLRTARDEPSLTRTTWTCEDASAFLDLDDPAQWERFAGA